MSTSTDISPQVSPVAATAAAHHPIAETPGESQHSDLLQELKRWFDLEFVLVDTGGSKQLNNPPDLPLGLWNEQFEVLHEVVSRGGAEFVADEDPFVALAIPLSGNNLAKHVAVGLFTINPIQSVQEITDACSNLGVERQRTYAWAKGQQVWSPQTLMRMAELWQEKFVAKQRAVQLESEVEQITTHLLSTYEEISLLHRLTENLKLTSGDNELGRMAMEWLAQVLPVEGLAIKLSQVDDEGNVNHELRTEEVVLTYGNCPVDPSDFDRFLKTLGREALHEPIVINRSVTSKPNWEFAGVHEVISTPLIEGENIFGWLVAINNSEGNEFGTVEANLVSSVGAILGIHGGNSELYRKQAEFFANVVRALTSAIDAKDPYTCGHSDRVARVAVRLAQQLGCDAETLDTIYLSGLLHDIGKIGIDDNVLRKPGKLTPAEYEHIKLHPELGYKILKDLKQLDRVLPVVLHHHEAWDGTGYPHQLVGEETPFLARIVAVADSFDAMSSDRPYRKGMSYDKVESILKGGAGTQWDPAVVTAFFEVRQEIYEIADRERYAVRLT